MALGAAAAGVRSALNRAYGVGKHGDSWYTRLKHRGRQGYGWASEHGGRLRDRASDAYQLFRAGLRQSGTGSPNRGTAWARAGDATGRGYRRARHYAGFPRAFYSQHGKEWDERLSALANKYPVGTGLAATGGAALLGAGAVGALAGGDAEDEYSEQQLLELYERYVELGVWNPQEDGGFEEFVDTLQVP